MAHGQNGDLLSARVRFEDSQESLQGECGNKTVLVKGRQPFGARVPGQFDTLIEGGCDAQVGPVVHQPAAARQGRALDGRQVGRTIVDHKNEVDLLADCREVPLQGRVRIVGDNNRGDTLT